VPVLADALGPKAQRRVLVLSVAAAAVVAMLIAVGVRRLAVNHQLEWRRWEPYTRWSVMKFLLGGLGNTLRVAIVAMALAMTLGALLALGRLAQNVVARTLAGVYVEFFRGVPVLLLILFSAVGLPQYGLDVSRYWYLVFGLVAYNSAVLAEVFRAGILSLDRGQREAGLALGLTYWQVMTAVLIPQAARRMMPAIVSQLVTLLKDTALGFVIAYEELLRRGRISGEFFHDILQAYVVVAVIYALVNFALSRLARRLEVRQRERYQASEIAVHGVEDLAALAAPAPPARGA
jgi:glutamate transport system permease protein